MEMISTCLLNQLQGKTRMVCLSITNICQGDAIGAECIASNPWTCPCPNSSQVPPEHVWEFLYHQIFSFVLCVLCVLSLCRTKPLFISYPLFWLQNNEKDWNKKQVVPGTFTWTRWTSPQPETNPTVWLPRHPQGRVFRVHLAGKPPLVVLFAPLFSTLFPVRTFSSWHIAHMLVLHLHGVMSVLSSYRTKELIIIICFHLLRGLY